MNKDVPYVLSNKINIDPNKKNIIAFVKDLYKIKNYHSRYTIPIIEELKKDFNILFFSKTAEKEILENNFWLNDNFSETLLRSNDSSDYIELNDDSIKNALLKDLSFIKEIEYLIIFGSHAIVLPSTRYIGKKQSLDLYSRNNEYFDCVINDKDTLNLINKINIDIIKNLSKKVSPIAFSTKGIAFYLDIIKFLHETKRIKSEVKLIIDDPLTYTPVFNNIPHKVFYFADDKRGTRNFNRFDHAQIQHILTEKTDQSNDNLLNSFSNESKDLYSNNFIFYGTLFQDKKIARHELWDTFLKDFVYEKSVYYIPIKKNWTGIHKLHITNGDKKNVLDINSEMFNSIIKHPLYEIQDEFPISVKTLSKYKYSLVARCVSFSDSLNFRPIFYTIAGVLPLLDFKYDPFFIQIPKEIAERITVYDHIDMKNKIDYFEKNPDNRLYIINKLRSLFRIDEWEKDPNGMLKNEIKRLLNEY